MDEFFNSYSDEFFIIDCNNLDSVKSKLYGFSICNGEIIFNHDIVENKLNGLGTYICIEKNNNSISISQDNNGNWGLYIFKDENYFAISNSFLKLVEFIRDDFQITINDDYAKSLILTNSCSMIFKETLINEIEVIPRNYSLHIDILKKTITYEKLDLNVNSIPINTKNCLKVLDNWYYKWTAILRNLKEKTNNIEINLHDDFQSRIILMFIFSSNIDLNKIRFLNFNSNDVDFAKEFGFNWGNDVISSRKEYFNDWTTTMNLIFYSEMGISNNFDYNFYKYNSPIYTFGGEEALTNFNFHSHENLDDILEYYLNTAGNWDDSLKIPFNRIFKNSLVNLINEFSPRFNNPDDLRKIHYIEVIHRNYFGKRSLMKYMANCFNLNPLADSEFQQLKLTNDSLTNMTLLMTLIFLRYCPKMLDNFIKRYEVDQMVLNFAEKINKSYPFQFKEFEFVSGPPISSLNNQNKHDDKKSGDVHYLEKIFKSSAYEEQFINYFSTRLYNKISHLLFDGDDFSLERANASFSVLKVIDDVNSFGNYSGSLGCYWLEQFTEENSKKNTCYNLLNFNKDLIKFVQDKILKNDFYKSINFDIVNNKVNDNDFIEFNNIKVFDFENNPVNVNVDDLFLEVNDSLIFQFNKLVHDSLSGSYFLKASEIGVGIHTVCIRYKYNYSDDYKIFIKNHNNLIDFNIWSGTELDDNINGFITGGGQLIKSSDDWAFFGNKSFKILKVNDEGLWTDLLLSDLNCGDTVHASFSVFNPNCKVNMFFVFTDNQNNQRFSNSLLNLKSDNAKTISMDCSIDDDIIAVSLRFCILGDVGSTCYIDNINITKI